MKRIILILAVVFLVFASAAVGAFVGGTYIYTRLNSQTEKPQVIQSAVEATKPVSHISVSSTDINTMITDESCQFLIRL